MEYGYYPIREIRGFPYMGQEHTGQSIFTYMLNNPVGQKLPQYYDMGQSGAPARFGASVTFKI